MDTHVQVMGGDTTATLLHNVFMWNCEKKINSWKNSRQLYIRGGTYPQLLPHTIFAYYMYEQQPTILFKSTRPAWRITIATAIEFINLAHYSCVYATGDVCYRFMISTLYVKKNGMKENRRSEKKLKEKKNKKNVEVSKKVTVPLCVQSSSA